MEAFKVGLIIAAAALSACAAAVTLKAPGGVYYYYGAVDHFSPDGKLPYGNTEAAVKREVLDGGARIIETVTQPGSSPSMPPEEYVAELKRRKKTLVYDVSAAGAAFSGTVTFKDPGLKAWTYDIKLKSGGMLKGSGRLTPEGIKTEKRFSGGDRPMLFKESLKPVSEREYTRRVEEMRPAKDAE